MGVSVERVIKGVREYMFKSIIPAMDSKRQFVAGMAFEIFAGNAERILRSYADKEWARLFQIFCEDGTVNIERVYAAAEAQIQRQGKLEIDIPMMGHYAFNAADIAQLYSLIKEG